MRKRLRTSSIRIVQHNGYRSNISVTTALENCDADILLVSEPWWGEIGGDNFGGVKHPGYDTLLPTQTVPADARPRVMAYVRRREDFQVALRVDLVQDLDFLLLEIQQRPHPSVLIAHIYNQIPGGDPGDDYNPGHREWSFDRFKRLQLPDMPVMVTGDFNLHSRVWDSFCTRTSARATDFLEWIEDHDYNILNDPREPTFISRDKRSKSVIDLTLVNRELVALDIVRDWHVDEAKS